MNAIMETVPHYNMLSPAPEYLTARYKTFDFPLRGCTLRDGRVDALRAYLMCVQNEENKRGDKIYLTLVEEPTNEYDPNAILIESRGYDEGVCGYVGKEYTKQIKEILDECDSYRVDVEDEKYFDIGHIPRDVYCTITWI